MKRIAVTGATGFLGRSVVRRLLADGSAVVVVVRPSSNASLLYSEAGGSVDVTVHNGATTDLVASFSHFEVDSVVHLATHFVSDHEPHDVEPLAAANVLFGMQVAEAACRNGVTRFVNLSTTWQHAGTGQPEYSPLNLYAATKQAFDDILTFYSKSQGLRIIHLEICDTYGPGDERCKVLPLLLKAAANGQTLEMSPGGQRLDLVHVDDAAEAVVTALQLTETMREGNTARFSITAGEGVSLRGLVTLLNEVTGSEISVHWAGRPYRNREVLSPRPTYATLPGWSPRQTLVDGLSSLVGSR